MALTPCRYSFNVKKDHSIREYLLSGVSFLRENPQLWFTAMVAVVICGAYVAMSLWFTRITFDAQEQLFADRSGWLLDGITAFAPEILNDRVLFRERLRYMVDLNENMEEIVVLIPHGVDAWMIHVSTNEEREGVVTSFRNTLDSAILYPAWSQPKSPPFYTTLGKGVDRRFVTAKAITDVTGAPLALVVSTLRLSEADMRIEGSIFKSNVTLACILLVVMFLFFRHARIVDFATLYRKQVEIDQMKDSFLSMASHELKSPLTVIRGYIEYLRDDTLEASQRSEFLRRIDVSAEELRQLIDDILDVSRIEMGRLRLTPEPVRSATMIDEVVEMFATAMRDKGLQVHVDIANDTRDSHISLDRGRLKQVLVNLMSNALKYTNTGTITIGQNQKGDMLDIYVHDTGMGMTAGEQKKLFEKFYRVENEDTKGVRGTGLGLWITKYMTEHMGGSISVESIKGQGSRFVVTFPILRMETKQS